MPAPPPVATTVVATSQGFQASGPAKAPPAHKQAPIAKFAKGAKVAVVPPAVAPAVVPDDGRAQAEALRQQQELELRKQQQAAELMRQQQEVERLELARKRQQEEARQLMLAEQQRIRAQQQELAAQKQAEEAALLRERQRLAQEEAHMEQRRRQLANESSEAERKRRDLEAKEAELMQMAQREKAALDSQRALAAKEFAQEGMSQEALRNEVALSNVRVAQLEAELEREVQLRRAAEKRVQMAMAKPASATEGSKAAAMVMSEASDLLDAYSDCFAQLTAAIIAANAHERIAKEATRAAVAVIKAQGTEAQKAELAANLKVAREGQGDLPASSCS